MDLLAAMVALAPPVVGKVAKILGDIWQDYRTGRQARQGIAVNSQGYYREIPDLAGALSIPRTGVPIEPPVLLTGRFVAEEFFVDLTDYGPAAIHFMHLLSIRSSMRCWVAGIHTLKA